MTTFTLGPWHVMENGFSRKGLWSAPTVYAADDELRYIAICACADDMNVFSATDNIANAHLISSAPDMYGALKAIIERWDTPAWKDVEPTAEVINRARAALSKAEGGT
jgi:hypothetical protein